MSEATFWEDSRCTDAVDLHNWGKWRDIKVWYTAADRQVRVCSRCNRKEERGFDE